MSDYLKERKKYYYIASLVAIAIIFAAILALIFPALFSDFTGGLVGFFGQAPIISTVEEDIPWSLAQAWGTFNFGLVLAAGGIILLLWQTFKKEEQGEVFVLIWSVVMLVCTIQRINYEYYFAVNIALLSALCLGCAWNYGAGQVLSRLGLFPGVMRPGQKTGAAADEPARPERQKKGKGKGAKVSGMHTGRTIYRLW